MSEAKYSEDALQEKKSSSKDEINSKVAPEESLIDKVKRCFYEDESFSNTFETFANDNCDNFLVDQEENKLEYTALHNQFVELFESKMKDFVEAQNSTISDLYDQIRQAVEEEPDGDASLFAQIMVATTDFDIFLQMMKEARMQQLAKADRK